MSQGQQEEARGFEPQGSPPSQMACLPRQSTPGLGDDRAICWCGLGVTLGTFQVIPIHFSSPKGATPVTVLFPWTHPSPSPQFHHDRHRSESGGPRVSKCYGSLGGKPGLIGLAASPGGQSRSGSFLNKHHTSCSLEEQVSWGQHPNLAGGSWRFDPLEVQGQSDPLSGLRGPFAMTRKRCRNFCFLPLILFSATGVKDRSPEISDEIELGAGWGQGMNQQRWCWS